jgi:hypothetical protein
VHCINAQATTTRHATRGSVGRGTCCQSPRSSALCSAGRSSLSCSAAVSCASEQSSEQAREYLAQCQRVRDTCARRVVFEHAGPCKAENASAPAHPPPPERVRRQPRAQQGVAHKPECGPVGLLRTAPRSPRSGPVDGRDTSRTPFIVCTIINTLFLLCPCFFFLLLCTWAGHLPHAKTGLQ